MTGHEDRRHIAKSRPWVYNKEGDWGGSREGKSISCTVLFCEIEDGKCLQFENLEDRTNILSKQTVAVRPRLILEKS